jgi:hypothetical protein
MEAIISAIKLERTKKLILLFGIFIVCILLISNTLNQSNENIKQVLTILALLCFVFGILLLKDLLNSWDLDSHPIINYLNNQPKEIVWVYEFQVLVMPFGIRFWSEKTLFFKLLNGETLQLRIPSKNSEKIQTALENRLTHASFGFSKEKEQWYMANPALLYRDDF